MDDHLVTGDFVVDRVGETAGQQPVMIVPDGMRAGIKDE
jgi:hypothetical protein